MTLRLRAPSGRWAPRAAAATLVAIVLVAAAAPAIAPYGPKVSGDLVTDRLQPPSRRHPLGTDMAARDVASRLAYGTRVSVGTAALAALVVLVVGVAWGGVAGMAPPALDALLMRIVDALLAMPRLLIVMALVAFIGRMSSDSLAILLGLTSWPATSRVVRARVRELMTADHVVAARAIGVAPARIFVRHVLPGTVPAILVGLVLTIATVIPLEAALSYFGVGIAPPTPSWGTLLQDASARPTVAWWMLLFPSLAIVATILSVNVLGERLQQRITAERSS